MKEDKAGSIALASPNPVRGPDVQWMPIHGVKAPSEGMEGHRVPRLSLGVREDFVEGTSGELSPVEEETEGWVSEEGVPGRGHNAMEVPLV